MLPLRMPAPKVLVSALILLVGGVGIWAFAKAQRARADGEGVRLVDSGGDLRELLGDRARESGGGASGLLDPLLRPPLDEDLARRFYPALGEGPRNVYDPRAYFVSSPHFEAQRTFREHPRGGWPIRTDARGLRREGELAARRPDLRVLVAGDSHVEGVVPVEETLTARLEALLAERRTGRTVEVLNAARGGYDFYNYLGVLERNLDLAPHVYVVIVYGGNDFAGFLPLHLYFQGRELPSAGEGWSNDLELARRMYGQAISQGYHQVGYFARANGALELALEGSVEVVAATARLAAEHGIRFLCAYLPPIADVERARVEEGLDLVEQILALTPDDIASTERLADGFLAALESRGIETLDLRPTLRAAPGPLYWLVDHHLATRGHEVAARALFEHLAREQ